jgi:transcription initiation factor IIE alpha subunit
VGQEMIRWILDWQKRKTIREIQLLCQRLKDAIKQERQNENKQNDNANVKLNSDEASDYTRNCPTA